MTCFLPACLSRDLADDDSSTTLDATTTESGLSGATQTADETDTSDDSAGTTTTAEEPDDSSTTQEDPVLPPSHEGIPCDAPGALQECSKGETVGFEICAGYLEGEGTSYRWSECFIEACSDPEEIRPCETTDGFPGIQRCMPGRPDLAPFWGSCHQDVCEPGAEKNCELDELPDWTMECILNEAGVAEWDWFACNTPLVLSFDGREPAFSAPLAAAAAFDIGGRGVCTAPDWPGPDTPWLARDLDRNGAIDGGHELFGSGTILASRRHARHGFEALAELDADGDGFITPRDPAWPELLLWADHDGDRRSSGWELLPLEAYGIDSLDLGYHVAPVCDVRGNCGRERAAFTFRRGHASVTGQIVDVHLACD
ncbi:MAG TPA: hypothetical protein VIK91_17415 [Nannocystis sp.]